MSTLVLVGDCAYPLVGSKYPADMFAVCGYLGGDTPHIWTDDEITAVRHMGLQFWPIWTAPNSKSGTRIYDIIGEQDGRAMVVALRARGIPSDTPVFYDVESSTYTADPAAAREAISGFKREVYAGGYPNVFAYCTKAFNRDWVAWWTNIRPTSLPPDWVGQQFSGTQGLDLSVFDLERLGVEMSVDLTPASVEAVRAAVMGSVEKYMVAQFGGSVNRLVQLLGLETAEAADVAAIKAKFTSFGQPGSGLTPAEEHEIAVEMSKVFGSVLSNAV